MAGAGPQLLLLLFAVPIAPAGGALRLLLGAAPPFICSQPDLHCLVRNSTCMEASWKPDLTPSAPSSLHVSPDVFHQMDGKLLPVLRIEWKVATDASVRYLEGAELAVVQVNNNQQVCAQFAFQNNLPLQVRPDGGRWSFTFDRFEVEPGQTYQVTVYHLPKLSVDGDNNCKSKSFTMPGCTDSLMKKTTPCINTGSLWEPRIQGESLGDSTLLVSFNPWMEPTRYKIHVASFLNQTRCKMISHDFTEGGQQEQVNITIKIEKNIRACCSYEIQIQPFFMNCGTDCLRHSAFIPCSPAPSTDPAGDRIIWIYWCVTGICVLLVGSVIAGVICMTKRRAAHRRGKCSHADLQTALCSDLPVPPLKPRKVWVVYSADHLLYVEVVLRFAEFLMTVCGTAVALDLLADHQISELGPLPWLTRQKKEMEDLSSKIIILCSRGTQAKWQAMLGGEPVRLKQDRQKPMGDLFTPALNLILPDFKKPACFGMYIVCYFEGISGEGDIPDLFNVTSRYRLMDKFEDVYFRIQDLEKFEPGRVRRVREIAAGSYSQTPSGRKLKEAVEKFKSWQMEHPEWFEKETICLDNDEELQSLSRESQVEESLPSEAGGIVKHQLHLREPCPECCCVLNLHMQEGGSAGCKLQPQLNPCGDRPAQTTVLSVEEAPLVQTVEPVSSVEDGNVLSHHVLSNEDCMEGVPLLETSFPMRNSVILPSDSEVSAIDEQGPASLSGELRQHLNGLMCFLYQQSVIPSEPPLCQEKPDKQQQLVFDDQHKDQRQSVQSDQGYISRCSPLPPDDLVEEEEKEEEGEKQENCELSPEVMNSLKSLQQWLFLQDVQRNSDWGYPAEVMDVGQSLEDC
ncbi:interleukin-17 receptor A [Dryobates pubescens]|uniref:interleukin-17 receptor A n=1 Tax=Dryobates pubescens TaxID=118200 RepID=UPI0023B8D564|nr:interleukin-17 receptor A [Dryobates pubescens]